MGHANRQQNADALIPQSSRSAIRPCIEVLRGEKGRLISAVVIGLLLFGWHRVTYQAHSSILPWGPSYLVDHGQNPLISGVSVAQVLPLERGAGMAQVGMRKAEEVLGQGDWVHIFPEGTRSRDGRIGPARRGVARLITSCQQPPIGEARPVHQ